MGGMDIRNPLRQTLVEPKLPIGIPDLDIASWGWSVGVELPDHLHVFRLTNDLLSKILLNQTNEQRYQHHHEQISEVTKGHNTWSSVQRMSGTHILEPFF